MKTEILSKLLLATVVFLSVGAISLSAKEMKLRTDKLSNALSVPAEKLKNMKSEKKRFGKAKLAPKAYNNSAWIEPKRDVEYKRGSIATH